MCDLEFGHTLLTGQETSRQRKEQRTCTQVSISLYAAVFFSSFSHKHGIAENRFVFTTYALSGQLYENVAIRRHIFCKFGAIAFFFCTAITGLFFSYSGVAWILHIDGELLQNPVVPKPRSEGILALSCGAWDEIKLVARPGGWGIYLPG